MNKAKRSWDILTQKQRDISVKAVIDYFDTERDEEIGVVAANELVDMFLMTIGAMIFNHGIEAAKKLITEHLEKANLELEISLKQEEPKR